MRITNILRKIIIKICRKVGVHRLRNDFTAGKISLLFFCENQALFSRKFEDYALKLEDCAYLIRNDEFVLYS